MRAHHLLLSLACVSAAAPALAQADRAPDPARQKAITADLNTCAKPVWPQESLRREETGRVTLGFLIGLDGTVLESKVLESSGHPLLDLAARDGLEKCRFTPPPQVGRTQPQWTKMQYVWTLAPTDPEKRAAERANILAAAGQGDAEAQFKAAAIYMSGPEANTELAISLLRKSAEQGHIGAAEALGAWLLSGRVADGDPAEAEPLLRKAAEGGTPRAQHAYSYLLWRNGDREAAIVWLRKSASQGYALAQAELGARLLADDATLAEAVALLQAAADQQARHGQFMLGTCYEMGRGVTQDRTKARALYERAAAGGSPGAQAALDRMKAAGG
ncbi:MAG TPA: TonB family protein [Pseudoduganella sp.]